MDYSKIANISTSLPHFRDSFPSPSFDAPHEYKSLSSDIYIAPLSASSLKTYNDMSGSSMLKRKALQHEAELEPKRMMMFPSFGRQRQESGCSVSSSSSWSSSATFSTVSSASHSASSPSLSPSPRSAYKSSSPSPVPSESTSTMEGDESNPLWQICAAIDLIGDTPQAKKRASAHPYAKRSFKPIYGDDSPYGVKIVFLAPNWLSEHIAKAKEVAALKRLQKKRFH